MIFGFNNQSNNKDISNLLVLGKRKKEEKNIKRKS